MAYRFRDWHVERAFLKSKSNGDVIVLCSYEFRWLLIRSNFVPFFTFIESIERRYWEMKSDFISSGVASAIVMVESYNVSICSSIKNVFWWKWKQLSNNNVFSMNTNIKFSTSLWNLTITFFAMLKSYTPVT